MAKRRLSALCVALAIAGCQASSSSSSVSAAQRACATGAAHVEVHLSGTIARYLGTRYSQSGRHEGFLVRTRDFAAPLKIEDNVEITGFIPMRTGDSVELQGQYECNDGVIHWTHHDPSGRHLSGYVIVNGRRFQ